MKVLVILTNLFYCIYKWICDCIDDTSDKITDILGGILYCVFAYPFKILALFFNYLDRFNKLNRNFEKNKKAFLEWYREQNKEELKQDG